MRRIITLSVLLLSSNLYCQAQTDSLSVQLFAEAYHGIVPDRPINQTRPPFFFNYTKTNQPSFNLAFAKLHYSTPRVRVNFGLMKGDYPKANLANEANWAKHIYEANVGIRLTKQYNVWLDAGVMPSHIGFESVIGSHNPVATRSIVAENSPYYETGLRLSYEPNEQWYLAMLTFTGWQTMTVPADHLGTHWGMQVTYNPSTRWLFNSSSFIGKVYDGRNLTRLYSNLYSTFLISNRSNITIGWDLGMQANRTYGAETNYWNDLLAIYQYRIKPGKWSAAFRYEWILDKNHVLYTIATNPVAGFHVQQVSANLDWQPFRQLLLRAELNHLYSPENVFYKGNLPVNKQFSAFLMADFEFRWNKKKTASNEKRIR